MIPAIASLVDIRKRSFSFRPMDPQIREELKRFILVRHACTHTKTHTLSRSLTHTHIHECTKVCISFGLNLNG